MSPTARPEQKQVFCEDKDSKLTACSHLPSVKFLSVSFPFTFLSAADVPPVPLGLPLTAKAVLERS